MLEAPEFQDLIREQAPLGTVDQVARAHPRAFVEHIRNQVPAEGMLRLDSDTTVSAGSFEAAMRASGAACQAVDEVMKGLVDNAFSAHRPPGHHAETMTAMGFCLFNHAAVAARHAQAEHGAERVAIMDFDVHHGNGTQDIFWSDPSVLYASTHQMPLYPGTGEKSETGVSGNIVNAPLRAGDDGEAFREAMDTRVLPAIEAFPPRPSDHLGRLRRAPPRPAGRTQPRGGRLRLGDAADDGGRRPGLRRPGRVTDGGRLRPDRSLPERRGHVQTLMGH